MAENKIRKVDSTKTNPTHVLPTGGAQSAGVAYDAGRKGLIINPDADPANRLLYPETWTEAVVVTAGAAAADWPSIFYVAPFGVEVVSVRGRHEVNGGAGAEFRIKKVASGAAVPAHGAGTDVLNAAQSVAAGATTNWTPALHATVANRQLAAGEALALTTGGTLTALDNVTIMVELKRRPTVA